jgi:hypothetical protein
MSPLFGLLVDKTGKNIIWVLYAVAATLVSHMMLAFTFWNPWIAMVMSREPHVHVCCTQQTQLAAEGDMT